MKIHLPFAPVACPRPKISMRGKTPVPYYPQKYTTFRNNVKTWISNNYPEAMFSADSILYLHYTFVLPRPKSLMRKKDPQGRIPHSKKPDLDNLVKSVNDAFEGLVFAQDSHVQMILAHKWIAAKDEKPSIEVIVEEISYENT